MDPAETNLLPPVAEAAQAPPQSPVVEAAQAARPPAAAEAAQAAQPAPGPSHQIDRSTQADGCPWEYSRVRRSVLCNVPRLAVVEPPPAYRDGKLTPTEREFAIRIEGRSQRRLCSCHTCLSHALRLTEKAMPAESPAIPGVRLMTLPGLQLPPSTDDQRQRLSQFLQRHPEQSLVACGCETCTIHQNCVQAWVRARRSRPPFLPAAGGCHERDN